MDYLSPGPNKTNNKKGTFAVVYSNNILLLKKSSYYNCMSESVE